MEYSITAIKGCYKIAPKLFKDSRGYFFESYNKNSFNNNIGHCDFVQDNQSYSSKGTLRGLHYQKGSYAQAKLVRVVKGKVLDVVVDLRVNSPSFGKHEVFELSAENNTQIFVPRGCAHGFVVLSDDAIFSYKCDNFYSKEHEGGIIFNDSELAINWQLPHSSLIVSDKDLVLPSFKSYKENPCF